MPLALMARHVCEEQSGFTVTAHHTVFAGLCPECRVEGGKAARRRGGREASSVL